MGEFRAPPLLLREMLKGTVEQIVYSNPENAYTVLKLGVEEGPSPATVIGNFLGVEKGEELQLRGQWMDHPQYGRQFKASHYERNKPSTLKGIRSYLDSMVDGIGSKLAKRLVDYFKLDTLRIIDEEPERLSEVKGIARARVGQIRYAWEKHRALQEVMVFLQGYQVTSNQAIKIFKRYGAETIQIVRSDPYRLATEVHGFGFQTADQIAMSLGIERDSLVRAKAALVFFLNEGSRQGNMFYPKKQLVQEATEQFGIPRDRLEEAILHLDQSGELIIEPYEDDLALYLRVLAACERGSARRVRQLLGAQEKVSASALAYAIKVFEEESGLELAEAQREAIEMAACSPFSIITGGPGTGKTTIVRAVCHWGLKQGWDIKLAAPTGRAAKRLSEASNLAASTLHRMLEFSPHEGKFQRQAERPIEADLLIVDEASMLDIYLFYAVIRALPPGARLLLVGDADQLPSVGPGNVLRDLISCGIVPVARLQQIFRQKDTGYIVENAHRINRGQVPVLPTPPPDRLLDFYFIPAKIARTKRRMPERQARAIWTAETIVDLVVNRIPKRFGLKATEDIQVISPMHRGEIGVQNLNQMLQRALAGRAASIEFGNKRFHLGDRVLQTRNDYDKEVFNGDIGRVESIDKDNARIQVSFDDRLLTYERSELDDLTLAYAISVHKSQGSEYPAVILPVMYQHYIMLQRNLLYTALTRGKQLVVLIGAHDALEYAVSNDQNKRRFSRLSWRLQEGQEVLFAARALASDRC